MKGIYKRLITGIVLVSVLVLATVSGPTIFLSLIGLILVITLNEFYNLIKTSGNGTPNKYLGIGVALVLFCTIQQNFIGCSDISLVPIIVLGLASIFIFEMFQNRENNAFNNVAYTILGVVYIGLSLSSSAILIYPDSSIFVSSGYTPYMILFTLILIWTNDTGAYLFGVTFGKHKMCKTISPKKSWEGTIGGALSVVVVGLILSRTMIPIVWYHAVGLSLVISCSAVIGDLIESKFKRDINVKDSSNILPGHGGLLDRFDSLILAMPMVACYLLFFK